MNRLIAIVAAIVVIGLGGIWWFAGQQSAPGLDLPSSANAPEVSADSSLGLDMALGNPDAPVTVIEYASFTCPHCAAFHAGNFKKLKSEFIDTGKINFIYREVYFDKFGLWAGLIARCGGTTDRYFALTDLIYQNQKTWTRAQNDAGFSTNLIQLGKTAGFTEEELNTCLQDEDLATSMVAAYQKNATEDGISSTPSFVINGKLYSNMGWDEFQNVLIDAGAD